MLSQIIGLAIDVGLGALAYRLTRQLEHVVKTLGDMVKSHDERIKALESKD